GRVATQNPILPAGGEMSREKKEKAHHKTSPSRNPSSAAGIEIAAERLLPIGEIERRCVRSTLPPKHLCSGHAFSMNQVFRPPTTAQPSPRGGGYHDIRQAHPHPVSHGARRPARRRAVAAVGLR